MPTCVRCASLVGALFVLGMPGALRAVPLPPASEVFLVDGGVTAGPMIAVDGALLFTYRCRDCPFGPESPLPGVVVTAADGAVQPGTLAVVYPAGAGVGALHYLRWVPDGPLPEGSYQVAITQGSMPDDWAGDTSSPLSVAGVAIDEPGFELDWRYDANYQRGAHFFACPGPCANGVESCTTVSSTHVPSPILLGELVQGTSVPQHPTQFLYRITLVDHGLGEPGPWQVLPEMFVARFFAERSEYCVRFEALRVRDDQVFTISSQCVDDPQPQTGPVPGPVPDTLACDASTQALYLREWCLDNAAICGGPNADHYPECAAHADACAPSPSSSPDAGSAGEGTGAGQAGGSARQSANRSAGGGCSVAPVAHEPRATWTWLLLPLLVAGALAMRARPVSSTRTRRSSRHSCSNRHPPARLSCWDGDDGSVLKDPC